MQKYQAIKRHQLYWGAVSLMIILLVYFLTAAPNNIWLFLTNFIIMLMTLAGMALKPEQTYSLEKMVYVFFFFFMGVVPLNDLFQHNSYWGGMVLKDDTLVMTNLLIIIGLMAFLLGAKLKLKKSMFLMSITEIKLKKINQLYFMAVFFSVALIILYVFDFNLIRLFVRNASAEFDFDMAVELTQIQSLIFNNFIRPAAILLLLILHYSLVYKRTLLKRTTFTFLDKILFSFVFVMAIMLIAPTSVARFLAATLYIPFILVFTKFWNKPYRMQVSIIASLLIVMPVLDKFRHFDISKIDMTLDLKFLNHGHFDAYQNFARVVELDLVTYGSQLLGAMLFFVPRSVWDEKPIGSGAFLSENANYYFSNISMPFIGEGYINFGIIGVTVFMLVLGFVLNSFDYFMWKLKKSGDKSILIYYYYILFGLIFFLMRGDLMSSFAYFVGISLSFWFFVLLFYVPLHLRVRLN